MWHNSSWSAAQLPKIPSYCGSSCVLQHQPQAEPAARHYSWDGEADPAPGTAGWQILLHMNLPCTKHLTPSNTPQHPPEYCSCPRKLNCMGCSIWGSKWTEDRHLVAAADQLWDAGHGDSPHLEPFHMLYPAQDDLCKLQWSTATG